MRPQSSGNLLYLCEIKYSGDEGLADVVWDILRLLGLQVFGGDFKVHLLDLLLLGLFFNEAGLLADFLDGQGRLLSRFLDSLPDSDRELFVPLDLLSHDRFFIPIGVAGLRFHE